MEALNLHRGCWQTCPGFPLGCKSWDVSSFWGNKDTDITFIDVDLFLFHLVLHLKDGYISPEMPDFFTHYIYFFAGSFFKPYLS